MSRPAVVSSGDSLPHTSADLARSQPKLRAEVLPQGRTQSADLAPNQPSLPHTPLPWPTRARSALRPLARYMYMCAGSGFRQSSGPVEASGNLMLIAERQLKNS